MITARRAPSYLACAACVCGLAAPSAASPRAAVHITAAVPAPSGRAADTVLIGRGGQVYRPKTATEWRLATTGGVAADVVGATRVGGNRLYAVGARTPVYVLDGTTWTTEALPNRGRTSVGAFGGHPLLGVGRHLYRYDKGKWRRTASARARILAVWATAAKRAYVLTSRGKIERLRGTAWNPVRHPLPADDQLRWLIGSGKRQRYAVSLDGVVLALGATQATVVARPADITGLDVHAVGSGPKGALLAGVAAGPTGRRSVLVRVAKGKMSVAAPLPPLDAGDRFAVVVADASGGVLVATTRGKLHLRVAGQWRTGTVNPAAPTAPARRFSRAGPARSH